MKSIVLSITSGSLDAGGKTRCSVACAQGKGRKIKGLLVRTDGSPWAHCRREGCSPDSPIPLSTKCHFISSSAKLCISSPPLGTDCYPSDLDKAQKTTGAKYPTVTPSPPPSLFHSIDKWQKIVQHPLGHCLWCWEPT